MNQFHQKLVMFLSFTTLKVTMEVNGNKFPLFQLMPSMKNLSQSLIQQSVVSAYFHDKQPISIMHHKKDMEFSTILKDFLIPENQYCTPLTRSILYKRTHDVIQSINPNLYEFIKQKIFMKKYMNTSAIDLYKTFKSTITYKELIDSAINNSFWAVIKIFGSMILYYLLFVVYGKVFNYMRDYFEWVRGLNKDNICHAGCNGVVVLFIKLFLNPQININDHKSKQKRYLCEQKKQQIVTLMRMSYFFK